MAAEWSSLAIRVNTFVLSLTDTHLAGGIIYTLEKKEVAVVRHLQMHVTRGAFKIKNIFYIAVIADVLAEVKSARLMHLPVGNARKIKYIVQIYPHLYSQLVRSIACYFKRIEYLLSPLLKDNVFMKKSKSDWN